MVKQPGKGYPVLPLWATREIRSHPILEREKAALIREALILLNRLSSNNAYSKPTLGVLTQSTAMATMTMDVVTRMCHEMNGCPAHDSTKKPPMEAEIADLARLFRTRVLSFLGEEDSS
ncbi:unnamed protein product [Spirodela intermedia]|uniref:Uncharacterized protein n=1 Tax=Spirodela intermedia TaxID=51605 RepID=A0A7I8JHG0_SPIIN|nr:unnamed protein product [Spirodela intermedia]CAA6669599.1 unnamed protein product [Spirodela intermedia]